MTRWLLVPVVVLAACAGGPPGPVTIDAAHDACEQCRMIVSDPRLAAEIVRPGEDPLVFDDIGCLREYLDAHPHGDGRRVFVAEHRTGTWVEATDAVYTHTGTLATPMASGIVAHADAQSRALDPLAATGEPVPVAAILREVTQEVARR